MNKIQTDKILTRSLNVDYAVTIIAFNFKFGMVLEGINTQSKNHFKIDFVRTKWIKYRLAKYRPSLKIKINDKTYGL